MKNNFYFSTTFDPVDVPSISRVDYMGYKFDQVISEGPHRTFKQAKAQHKKNLIEMIKLCQEALEKIEELTPETIQQDRIQ